MREEPRLKVIVNRILRRILESKKDENGERGKLQKAEFHNLHCDYIENVEVGSAFSQIGSTWACF